MGKPITPGEYRALAELRYLIRRFVREGDAVSSAAGLEPQQYLLLLMIRGISEEQEATVSVLAERLALKHHSVVELVDRLETHGYVRRNRSREDRRSVIVSLLPRGEKILEQVAQHRINELRATGAAFVKAIGALLEPGRSSRAAKKGSNASRERMKALG